MDDNEQKKKLNRYLGFVGHGSLSLLVVLLVTPHVFFMDE
jgi:hypothetical protein